MRNTPLLPSLPGPLGLGWVTPDMGPIYGLIELNRASFTILILAFKLYIYVKLNCLE